MKKLAVSCRVLRSLGVGGWLLAVSVAKVAGVAQAEPVEVRQQEVLDIFEKICEVPRYSSYEMKIGNWLMTWAETNGFAVVRDTVGNVIIDVPATTGMENRERVVLQTHQDMVRAVKAGVQHDWNQEPIVPVVEDGWIHSKDNATSLGADDGIGIATVLAIVRGDAPHGPLRLIMTVEEETSQVGVKEISPVTVADAKYLINVDFLEEGVVTISSACADINTFSKVPNCEASTLAKYSQYRTFKIDVSGLRGGHSGLDINDGRANAIIELGKMLSDLKVLPFRLSSATGGTAENAIPSSASAVIMVLGSMSDYVSKAANFVQDELRKNGDYDACVSVSEVVSPEKILSSTECDALLKLITGLANGVVKMSEVVPGLVQTSANLGIIDVDASEGRMKVVSMMRSSSEADYEDLLKRNEDLADSLGFGWSHLKNCEIWPADPSNELLEICTNVYKTAFGRDISVIATHAGLECGTFKAKNPELNIISVGPTVLNEHSIDERCDFAACLKVRNLLEGILFQIPECDDPVPVIVSFKPDFTQGPTSEVPTVSWQISGPFEQAVVTIDGTTVYDGDARSGEGRWRDVCSPGTHRLQLIVRHGDEEVSASRLYTALSEGDEPAVLPQIGYFYPDFYGGIEGDAPVVHWRADNITSVEIWVDASRVLVTQDAVSKFRFSQLRNAGTHILRIIAHNVTGDVESSFAYRTERRVGPVTLSAPLLQSAESAPVISEFYPDAYRASIRATPYIHWHLGGEVESLELTIDDTPVFIGGGNAASGRWLDVSGLNLDALNGSHEVMLSVSNAFGVVTSNFTCTCYWEEPPPPPMGSEENPWTIGENVQVYTNGFGTLVIIGEGATSNFTAAADLPWIGVVDSIKTVAIPEAVTVIGGNLWAGLGESVDINGETIMRRKEIAAGFPAEMPSGVISPAEFERIDIIDGKAYLGVAVWTNSEVKVRGVGVGEGVGEGEGEGVGGEGAGWGVATNGVIVVPAPGKQGFFYLLSKPAVQSDALPVFDPEIR